MCNEDKIISLAKSNNGIITSKELAEKNIDSIYLTRLVNKNKLEKIKNGLYVLPSTWGDEYFNLTYGNNAIFSYETALYFQGLCETVPSSYNITVKRGYNGSLKNNEKVILHYVDSNIFELGRITIKSPQGQYISCYDKERCICELLSDKDNYDIETIKYAIIEYLSDKKERDLPKLIDYSKTFKVYNDICKYIEILT